MKHAIAAFALSLMAMCAHAADKPSRALVELYLQASRMPQMSEAQVEGYAAQYGKGKDAVFQGKVRTYLNSVMGWEALKDEYIGLVQETYTEKEIRASLAFMESPIGRVMAQKNITFSNKMSALAAQKAQQVAAAQAQASRKEDQDDDEPSALVQFLSVSDVEEVQAGEATYFTGKIHNSGKKPARSVNIEANLFLGQKFVDQYATYITGAVPPGGFRLFKISCGCKGNPPARHDGYKIEISNAY